MSIPQIAMLSSLFLDLGGFPVVGVRSADHRRQQRHGVTQGRGLHQGTSSGGRWLG